MKQIQLTQPQMDRAIEQAIMVASHMLTAGGDAEGAKCAAIAVVQAAKAAAASIMIDPAADGAQ